MFLLDIEVSKYFVDWPLGVYCFQKNWSLYANEFNNNYCVLRLEITLRLGIAPTQ